jgi:protoheme IX farnesyltransferase
VEDRLSTATLAPAPGASPLAPAAARSGWLRLAATLFKLRIAFAIVLSALAGAALAGPGWQAPADMLLLALAVLVSAAGAGASNHYFERDIDAHMRRTRGRPFVTGELRASAGWPLLFFSMMLGGGALAALRLGLGSGLLVLAGALTYSLVYTLWLKRRTHWNIVIGGAAGSFAVLAGAASGGEMLSAEVLLLALVLLLWTPSHFWALAIAIVEDYRRAGVPMLPVTRGRGFAARCTFINSLLLVAASVALAAHVGDALLWVGCATGGGWMLWTSARLLLQPESGKQAMAAFRASLLQLGLLLMPMLLPVGAG